MFFFLVVLVLQLCLLRFLHVNAMFLSFPPSHQIPSVSPFPKSMDSLLLLHIHTGIYVYKYAHMYM